MERKLINVKDLVKRYSISRTTLRKWINDLKLPIVTISDKKRYVIESDLIAWEESMKIQILLKNID
jgi:predicted site-specific integrase-resolvase